MGRKFLSAVLFIALTVHPDAPRAQDKQDAQALIEADSMSLDQGDNVVTASGDVTIEYRGKKLSADQIKWDQNTDRITASGNVTFTDADGAVITSEEAELVDEMKEATLRRFWVVLQNNLRFSGEKATRLPGKMTKIENSKFTACRPCQDRPDAPPTWQLRSGETVYDEVGETVTHKHVRLEMRGVPVFYLPWLAHPAPEVRKRSGFLFPEVRSSSDRGIDLAIPYFVNLAPNYDLTLTPRLSEDGGSMLGVNWRHKSANSENSLTTHGLWLEEDQNPDNDKTFRGNVEAEGAFNLNAGWQAGYEYWWLSDKSFMKRYDLSDRDFFTSTAYLRKTDGRNSIDIRMLNYKTALNDVREDQLPEIAPQIRTEHYFPNLAGGELRLASDFLSLSKEAGGDMRRAMAETEWRRRTILGAGQIVDYFGGLRGLYHDYHGFETGGGASGDEADGDEETTLMAHAGIKWRMPLVKHQTDSTILVEPTAQLLLANEEARNPQTPNEDSRSGEFDSISLFEVHRHVGYDRTDSGSRLDMGVATSFTRARGASYRLFVGKSLRREAAESGAVGTRQGKKASDWLLDLEMRPSKGFGLSGQFRFDDEQEKLIRSEGEFFANFRDARFTLHYARLDESLTDDGRQREEVNSRLDYHLTGNWFLNGYIRYDLTREARLKNAVGLNYRDDCTDIRLTFNQSFTRDGNIGPRDGVTLKISLRTLGDTAQ